MTAHLDGNALAGTLGEVFAVDITTATGKCASCGTTGAIAAAHVYTGGPGVVARCPTCGQVLLRMAQGPGRAWLDLRGLVCLQVAVPGDQS